MSNKIIYLFYRYGIEYVRRWRFETWNEPDHHDFCGLQFSLASFLGYYDTTVAALRTAVAGSKLTLVSSASKRSTRSKSEGS